jgi:hypothetical protein
MNKFSLFLGNGINQLEHSGASWKEVLSELANFAGRPEIMDGSDYKPFTLIYEEVIAALAGPDLKKLEREVKEKVAEAVQKIPRNSFHEQFEEISVSHVLTPNYDYNLCPNANPENLRPESKYSVFRRRSTAEKSIWMIHGEANKPDTIMLGHEQYAGALQKIRSYVTERDRGSSGYSSPLWIGDYDFDQEGKVHSWIDVFLRDDIHILGFSLDYTEIDLWWIIAYKARLKRNSSLALGQTYFYLFSDNKSDPKVKAKESLLKSLEIKVYVREIKKNDYRFHYDWALKRLSKLQ